MTIPIEIETTETHARNLVGVTDGEGGDAGTDGGDGGGAGTDGGDGAGGVARNGGGSVLIAVSIVMECTVAVAGKMCIVAPHPGPSAAI